MEKFIITKDNITYIKRFNLQGRKVEFKIAPVPQNEEPTSWIKTSVEGIIQYAVKGLLPNDQVGITFCGNSFKERGPGWMNFKPASEITIEDIWEMISKIFQSNSEGLSTDTFCLGVTSVRLPEGRRNNRNNKYNTFIEECATRRGIAVIDNKDNLCLPRALVVAIASVKKDIDYRKIRRNIGKLQTRLVSKLLAESKIHIPIEGVGISELQQFQNHLKEYNIVVYQYGTKGRDVIFEGQSDGPRLNLLYNKNHYNVITSLTAAFCCAYYCETCHIPYNNKNDHRCGGTCPCCQQTPGCTNKNIVEIKCSQCNRRFRGQQCFDNHTASGSLNKKTVCEQIKRCMDCLKTYKADKIHVCGEYFCKICNKHVPQGHLCFIQQDNRKPSIKDTLFVFYDLETRQEKVLGEKVVQERSIGEIMLHEPNLCVFQQRCDHCIEKDLRICEKCGIRQQVLKVRPVQNFVEYLLNQRKLFKKVIIIAHNGQAFDHQFILSHILQNTNLKPELIMRGTKIIMMQLSNVKFIDSLNYFPMALALLPKAFDLPPIYKKGYFPHLFNTAENENYTGTLPSIEYYGPDTMKTEERAIFLKWYEEHKNGEFNMQRDIVEYCVSDVQILAEACLKFRKLMVDECNIEPFLEAVTIASACNLVYRRNFLKDRHYRDYSRKIIRQTLHNNLICRVGERILWFSEIFRGWPAK